MSIVSKADQIRQTHGYAGLWETCANRVHDQLSRVRPLDSICLRLSVRQLRRRMRAERTLEDVLDTTGTYYQPRGEYRGWGIYRSLWAKQAKEEIRDVATAAAARDPDTVVEIGSLNGGTLYVWSRVLEPAGTVVTVDVDHRGKERFFREFVSDLDAEMKLVEGDSHADGTVRELENAIDRGIEFLYIDGDHSYGGVKSDFETYSRYVADGGLVALHDVENEETGVPEFWNELEAEFDTETVGGSTGRSGLVYF